MKHKEGWKRLGAWALAFSMVAGSCPSMVFAEEADQQIVDVEEFSDQEQAVLEPSVEDVPAEEAFDDGFLSVPEEAEEPTEFTCEEAEPADLLSDGAEEPSEGEDPDDEGIAGYDLQIESATGTWHMLPGKEMTIRTFVIARYDDEDDGTDVESMDAEDSDDGDADDAIDYRLEFYNGLDNGTAYDSDLIEVTINDEDNSLTVKSKENVNGETQICVQAVTDSGSEKVVLDQVKIWLAVGPDYDVLMPLELDEDQDLQAGQQLDISKLQVVHYETGKEPVVREDVRFRLIDPDENAWYIKKSEAADDSGLPEIYRRTAETAALNIAADEKNDNGEWVELCSRTFEFDMLDYSVSFTNLRNDDYSTYVYNDEDHYQIGIDYSNLENLENWQIRWTVGKKAIDAETGAETFIPYEGTEDTRFWAADGDLYIDGGKLAKAYQEVEAGWWYEMRAEIVGFIGDPDQPEDEFVLDTEAIGLDLMNAMYDYQFGIENRRVLVDQNIWINKTGNCYVEDKDHKDGEDVAFQITGIELKAEEDNAFQIEEMEDGWNLHANKPGRVTALISYRDLKGEAQVYEIELSAETDLYHLNAFYPEDSNYILPGGTMKLPVTLTHDWWYGDDDMGGEEIQDFSLELTADEDGNLYDQALLKDVSISQEDGKTFINVEAADGEYLGEAAIYVRASIKQDQNESVVVAENEFYFQVQDEYDVIEMEKQNSNVPVGVTLDLNSLGISVRHVKNGQTTTRENVKYTVELDDGQWSVEEDPEAELPRLTRMGIDGTEVVLVAWSQDDHNEKNEIARRSIVFDGLDYSVWFDGLREGENSTYIFNDEKDYILQLDTQNLEDKTGYYRIAWDVGICTGDDEGLGAIEDTSFYSLDQEDSSKLHIDGEKLAELYKSLKEDQFIQFCAYVIAGASDAGGIEVFEQRANVWSRETVEDYQYFTYGEQLFKGDSFWLDKNFDCYVENSEYPWGEKINVAIKNLTIEQIAAPDGETAVSVEEKEDGYFLKGDSYGGARVTIFYDDIHGNEQSKEFDIWVNDTIYTLEAEFEKDAQMLYGESQNIYLKVYKKVQNEDGSITSTEIPSNEYQLRLDGDYDRNLILVELAQDKVIVQANNNGLQGNSWLPLAAESVEQYETEESEKYPVWEAHTGFNVSVSEQYYNIRLEGWDDNADIGGKVGSVVDLNQYNPTVEYAGLDPETGEKVTGTLDAKNVRWFVVYNEDKWTPTPETAEQDIKALVRTAGTTTQIVLVAQELHTDRYGNEFWENVAEKEIYFDRVLSKNQDVMISELRDQEFGYTWIYNNEICGLCIQMPERETESEALKVSWSLYGYQGKEKVLVPEENYSVNEDGTMLTLYGAKLWNTYKEMGASGAFWVRAEVYTGDELIGEDEAAVFVRYSDEACEHQWKDETVINPTCSENGSSVQRCEICGDTRIQMLPATGAHTWGEWVVAKAATCTEAGIKEARCAVCGGTKTEAIPATGAHTWGEWVVVKAVTCTEAGVKEARCAVCGGTKTEAIPTTGAHTWGEWTETKAPTYVDGGENTRSCSVCGAKEKAQTDPYILPIKRSQTATVVIPLAARDSITKVTSSNKKLVEVKKQKKNTIQLKASKRLTGNVVITIVTTKKQKKTLRVNVQKGSVTAWTLSNVPQEVTLKRKATYQLKPVITPVTCKTKLTYSSSNKRVATVSRTGKILAKKVGKVEITVKAGKNVSAKCVVIVRKK